MLLGRGTNFGEGETRWLQARKKNGSDRFFRSVDRFRSNFTVDSGSVDPFYNYTFSFILLLVVDRIVLGLLEFPKDARSSVVAFYGRAQRAVV